MKLKNVQIYPIKDVPEELTQRCIELSKKLSAVIFKECEYYDPNIILGALSFCHASTLKHLISDDKEQIEMAAKLAAVGLIKNVNFLIEAQEGGEL